MAIHGDKSQNARQQALGAFKNGNLKVLIATDIAARGIDVAGLSHVINYDLPNEPEAYVHRIGRTGRAGLGGDAISFCCIDEMKDLAAIEKLIGRKIPRQESAWPMEVFTETVKQPRPPRPERVARVNMRGEAVAEKKLPDAYRRSNGMQGQPATGAPQRSTNRFAAPVASKPATNSLQTAGAAGRVVNARSTNLAQGTRNAASTNAPQTRGQSAVARSAAPHSTRTGEGNRPYRQERRPEYAGETRFARAEGERSTQRQAAPQRRKYESR